MQIDYKRDNYLSEFSIKTLEDRYLVEGEKSPKMRLHEQQEPSLTMKHTHRDCMTTLVSCGSCLVRLF